LVYNPFTYFNTTQRQLVPTTCKDWRRDLYREYYNDPRKCSHEYKLCEICTFIPINVQHSLYVFDHLLICSYSVFLHYLQYGGAIQASTIVSSNETSSLLLKNVTLVDNVAKYVGIAYKVQFYKMNVGASLETCTLSVIRDQYLLLIRKSGLSKSHFRIQIRYVLMVVVCVSLFLSIHFVKPDFQ
jgi:hypothetical protein